MARSAVARRDSEPRQLTDKQRALVDAIVHAAETGAEITREEAGTLAGYGTGETARVAASRALALPYVRDYLVEQMKALAAQDAPAALATLRHVRRTGGAGHRLTAAIETLKLLGMGTESGPTGPAVTLNLHVSGDIATLLSQRPVIEHEAQAAQGLGEGEHHLAEAVGGQAEGEGGHDPSPMASPARARKRAPASKKRPAAVKRGGRA